MTEDIELYEAFFQKSKLYYLDKLIKFNAGQRYSFNFFAFLFGLFWFIYRKMYLEVILVIFLLVLEGALEELIVPESLSKEAYVIGTLAVASIVGFLANNLYIRKANRTIQAAKAMSQDIETQKAYLNKKGGVSYIVLIVLLLLLLGLVFYGKYQMANGY